MTLPHHHISYGPVKDLKENFQRRSVIEEQACRRHKKRDDYDSSLAFIPDGYKYGLQSDYGRVDLKLKAIWVRKQRR